MLDEGYGLMPNKVLYDPKLPASAKLLYCVISSHCAEKGYCWASNKYLGEKIGVSGDRAGKLVKTLGRYLKIEQGTNHLRKICLVKNNYVPSYKYRGSLVKNNYHNNINNNINKKGLSAEEEINRMYTRRKTRLPSYVKERG